MGVAFYSETWGALFFDFEHDGDLDLHVCDIKIGPNTNQTFFENVDTAFVQPSVMAGDTLKNFSSAMGDINNDGYIDLTSPNRFPSALQLWQHDGVGTNNWIKVKLEGKVSNRDAVGSWIEVYAGTKSYFRYTHCGYGYLGQNSRSEIIGISQDTLIDSLLIKWPSGHTDRFYQVKSNRKLDILEGSSMHAQLVANGPLMYCQGDSINTTLNLANGYAAYQWNTGDTTASISPSAPGAYRAVVTNTAGLTDTTDFLILAMDSLVVQATALSDTNNQGLGSATALPIGGIPLLNINGMIHCNNQEPPPLTF
ncbi:MAG: ASPIC/UnbV domain-containing protein [Owenweeksia sp.]|nr:ASPIC/UnbV domain-containing protein [Owenweeksia sp.]